MDFIAGDEITAAGGFQLSLLSVPDDLRYIIAAATGQGSGNQLDRIRNQIWGNKHQEQKLLSHLVKLLAPQLSEKEFRQSEQKHNPLIVIEER